MKRISQYLFLTAGVLLTLGACEKWTVTRPAHTVDLTLDGNIGVPGGKSEAYYEALRAYKQTDHEVAFGWFGNWTGTGTSLENSMMGLPDSVDFVSMWGNWANPGVDRLADFRRVRELKGTKALVCFLVFDIGDQITPSQPEDYDPEKHDGESWRHYFWGWGSTMEEHIAATQKYAKAILDTIAKYDYDGFDLDAEPSYAQPFETDKELWRAGDEVMEAFVETLATELGPKAGKGKLLVIDGEPEAMAARYGQYFDYFIIQAYGTSSSGALDSRYRTQMNHWTTLAPEEGGLTRAEVARKLIVCENFESMAANGGMYYTEANGGHVPSLIGMAKWEPSYDGETFTKGGVGTYHMEYEYGSDGKAVANDNVYYQAFPNYPCTYPWLRKAIQIMNPHID